MNGYFNPKVVYSAIAATLAGALMGAGVALAQGADTPKALLYAVGSGFLVGASTGLTGWAKSQGSWLPP